MKDEAEKASHTTVTLGIANVFLSLQLLPAFLNVRQNNMQHELRGLLVFVWSRRSALDFVKGLDLPIHQWLRDCYAELHFVTKLLKILSMHV